ncbi:glycosyltransferase [Streptomyces sp. NPDC017095]|uniref:glycosyltransferase n=1 Tax=Streptomyces sp. NPDC017095 TaxID=3364977 RepID=UPI0037A2362A
MRFGPTVAAGEREDLVARLRLTGATVRISPADVDHRALLDEARKLVRAVLLDTAGHLDGVGFAETGRVFRDWLRDTDAAAAGSGSAQLVTAEGRSVSVDGTVPDHAFAELARNAREPSAADRVAWDGTAWSPAASGGAAGVAPPASGRRPLRVLAIADEWFSGRGGISTINRELCAALARSAGVTVYCLITGSVSEGERLDAARADVALIEAPRAPLRSGQTLLLPPALPDGAEPDLVIGHGHVTGTHARGMVAGFFRRACLFHVVHTEPDLLEWRKPGREEDPARRAEERSWEQWQLGAGATRAVGVGPVLHRMLQRDLPRGAPPPLRLDPGFDLSRTPPPENLRGVPLVTLMGRLEDEDAKGVGLAVRATNRAVGLRPDLGRVDLMLRGTAEGRAAALAEKAAHWATEPDLRVLPRDYTTDRARLDHDLGRVWLALMPSRSEAFGLVGAEHIRAGVPCLVSADSGLGALLAEVVPELARHVVVPVTGREDDDAVWAHHIAAALAEPGIALERARKLRDAMAGARSWAAAAHTLLDAARAALAGPG